ncbi:hypothetical protein MKX01_025713 [Papaver californicum]|nr:hypothetical protein MKX01_025713 [Papaver californicum]
MDIVIKYYECEIRKKDEEVDFWKRKFFVLQSQCVIQKEELDAYKLKFDALSIELQEKKLDTYLVKGKLKDLTNGISTTQNDELRYKTMCEKLNEQIEELKRRCKASMSEAEFNLKCELDLERQLKDCKAQYKSRLEKQLNDQNEEFETRCKELATQAESRLEKEVDLEKQLNDYKAKYGEMYVRFKEGKQRMVAPKRDLKDYMRICCELNEQVESSEDKVRATSEAEKCIDKLSKKIVHLGDEKRKVEDESECLKTKFMEQESKTALYLKELDDYKVKCHDAFVGELEGYKMAMKGLKEQIMGLAEDRKNFCEREKKAEERIVYFQEVIKSLVEEKCIQLSRRANCLISTIMKSESFVNLDGDNGNVASPFKMEFVNRANEKINLEIEERKIVVFEQDNLKPAEIVQMRSKEDDKEIKTKHTYDFGSQQRLNVSTSKDDFFIRKMRNMV